MKLTHPDEVEDHDGPEHPIDDEDVEQALQMSGADITTETLHGHLETVQAAFEHNLTKYRFFDPMNQFGKVAHGIREGGRSSPYPRHLHMEDGKLGFDKDFQRRGSLVAKKFEEMEDPSPEKFDELVNSIDLDEWSEEEQYEAMRMHFGVWSEVADVLGLDRDAAEFKAVKFAHELAYKVGHTEYGTTGFVVGLPDMFWRGMRTEQRLFSAFVEKSKLPAAQLVDAYGSRASYRENSAWASKRGVSKSAVSQNRSKAREVLNSKFESRTTLGSLASQR